ncbi:UDP-N-acetylmuramoyl-L-alanyl-D-glutamate--2,6-diaminopimelate ligase [Ilumatobacter coccineus]|uniref:UDP-N-acetylmuramoyl-L-alanyl-D-glutamate--2,6-diaminopimelate ligase n=1 Tax=Ilumatobacter coccineus (strain NBRC 103263 / KCTC 29153 / YM16-304) TaxID=1313172 RepID=A0A6C7EE57_ILUCY|nr:UDP-N-acetylmuramoyl-L-alanyl-D-glutamate--2,6-diaminopimelate ligase [Ilumatobacter coccineus]BAN02256.1 UDP-N-acetylmuramoylalanyl-D-glutamate--2,6-diaminopimelate ligase [Ilumatobacter coccineus YM16-304]
MALNAAAVADAVRAVGVRCELIGDGSVEVIGATHDSRAVEHGSMFACLRGAAFDGHTFADSAVAAGASALLVDHELTGATGATQLVVDDTRIAVGPAAAAVYGHPSDALVTVGITGTNGKTTTAQLVATILDDVGHRTGVIGTLHGPRTTPEAADLQQTLAGFVTDGNTAAVMEVSSHALALHRVDGTTFDVVAFTNFGQDHLDLHETVEEYFRAKSMLFDRSFAPIAVVNVDDPHGRVLADVLTDRTGDDSMRVVEISVDEVTDVAVEAGRHSYRWRGHDVDVPIGGDFNVANSLAALTIAAELGIDLDAAVAGVARLSTVPGRFERVESAAADRRGISVVVDYAHTPDGLEQLLMSARRVVGPDHRVIVTFGCGGDRDRDKRPAMGDVSSRLADRTIVTSDNPRTEDPARIIDDVLSGVGEEYRSSTTSNPDRRAAIAEALDVAERGDIVLIAGKGHEATQDLGDVVIDFDDRRVAMALLDADAPLAEERTHTS